MRKTLLSATIVLLAVLMVTAPNFSPQVAAQEGTGSRYGTTNPRTAMGAAQAMDQFQELHPEVTIEFESRGFEEIRQTAPMILNSDEVPDVMEYNKGNATSGFLSQNGLLTDLTDVAIEYGWDQILSPGLQTTSRYENGIMGSGQWYGVTNYGEYVMVYYNKDMFAEHGVEVPTTFEEWEAAMQTFVDAGITPLSVGATEYPAQHIFYQLVLSKADRAWVDAFELYQGEVDFHDEAFTYAAEKIVDWVERGFISEDATGIAAEDMGVAFTNGEYPMMVSGSWWYGRFMNEIQNFEARSCGQRASRRIGGNLWVVPTNAKRVGLRVHRHTSLKSRAFWATRAVSQSMPTWQIEDPMARADQQFNAIIEADGRVTPTGPPRLL